ncbi:MAG: hypothetical protein AAGN35_23260 [Bacteroidota bacterium]
MAQSTLIPGSATQVNLPNLQVVDPQYFLLEQDFLDQLNSEKFEAAIQFCDDLLISLEAVKDQNHRSADWYLFKKYLHNVIFRHPSHPKFEHHNEFSGDIDYRIEYYTYHRDQLYKGISPKQPFKEALLSAFYCLKGGALFPEFWWTDPKINFHDDFVAEMINLTEIWNKHFYGDNPALPLVEDGFWGFREDEYTIVKRFPDSDIKLLEKAGFPYHKKGFAERFPWEVKIWEKIVAEWKKGKWVVFLP